MPDAKSATASPLSAEERDRLTELESSFLLFFRPAVLAQYRAESHLYEVSASDFDGTIGMTTAYVEEMQEAPDLDRGLSARFGYRELHSGEYAIALTTHDFNRFSDDHAARWRPFWLRPDALAPLPDRRFELWAARHFFGSWEVENNLIDRIAETVLLVNAATLEVMGERLFEHDASPHVMAPVVNNDHEYQNAHRELYAYLLDGLRRSAILKVLHLTGAPRPKGENGTRKLLQAALPTMADSPLWTALARVSDERGKAAHQVRPRAVRFDAFEAFESDLEEIRAGMEELLAAIESALGVDAKRARDRQADMVYLPKIDRPMENVHGVDGLDRIVGRTVARIEKGLHARGEKAHGSDVVHIHFTDGSVVGLVVQANAQDVSRDHGGFPPSEFNTNFFAHFVP